jgi:hypothetical protein
MNKGGRKVSKTILTMLLMAGLMALGLAATAAPSFFGYTGLVVVPTADSLNQGEYNLGAMALNLDAGADSNVYLANMGLADSFELGFARFKPEGGKGETLINAKYMFRGETERNPAMAVGVVDLTDETDTSTYIVLSKRMGGQAKTALGEITSPMIHIGVGGGRLDGIFGGVSATLGERFTLMAEYDSRDVNFGARLALTSEIRIHAALLDGEDVGTGISFNKLF